MFNICFMSVCVCYAYLIRNDNIWSLQTCYAFIICGKREAKNILNVSFWFVYFTSLLIFFSYSLFFFPANTGYTNHFHWSTRSITFSSHFLLNIFIFVADNQKRHWLNKCCSVLPFFIQFQPYTFKSPFFLTLIVLLGSVKNLSHQYLRVAVLSQGEWQDEVCVIIANDGVCSI